MLQIAIGFQILVGKEKRLITCSVELNFAAANLLKFVFF